MRSATATIATRPHPAFTCRRLIEVVAGDGGGEHRQFFGYLRRAAARAFGSLPFAGTNQDFAVFSAIPAMKFVNRH